ncbi:MAG: Smr/MutS family protein [Rhodothermales bacterium]|nr:Smr/MutS family protein [Rhodothermales bacterium]
MPYPSVSDDGSAVVLDLHGATVTHGIDLFVRALTLSHQRGRTTLKVIHGTSTSEYSSDRRTIKHELIRTLESGQHGSMISSMYESDGYTIIGLQPGQVSSNKITLREIDN